MTLSEKFYNMLDRLDTDESVKEEMFKMVMEAPDSYERDGMLALIYHDGIGVDIDLKKSFEYAEKAVDGLDALGLYILGYMCDNIETPDQAESGPLQKYDHYDAERFYERCAKIDSYWKEPATLWLAEYFMNGARGGDPEIGAEYYESIADTSEEAVCALSDYYWDLVMPNYPDDEEWCEKLFKWTKRAVEYDPEEYSFRMGWIYADGLGCEPSEEKASDYFHQAYLLGDWRGARAIASKFENILETDSDLSDDEREEIKRKIKEWHNMADEIYEESLDDEPENIIEED
ncbi:MAG: hypothetical protein K2G90_02270 [Muribaculaceae bacterium]|nr:hypothetical protein [Muribaculaceae bacterium]